MAIAEVTRALAALDLTTADGTAFAESTTLAEATHGQQPSGRRMRIKLIDAGWGSSGYYSPAVLAEAAKAGVFPTGPVPLLGEQGRFRMPEYSAATVLALSPVDRQRAAAHPNVTAEMRRPAAGSSNPAGGEVRSTSGPKTGGASHRRGPRGSTVPPENAALPKEPQADRSWWSSS